MVGDKLSDIEAGRLAGCTTVLIPGPETTTISCSADIVCATMTEAAEQMLAKIARWEQRDNEFLMLSPQDDSA
jgi:phosphoglycolate phosphatase-like HAD superfamily hydrolase